MLLLIPILWIFALHAEQLSGLSLLGLLGITGILVGGPNSIITSVVAVDLAQHPSIRGNEQACKFPAYMYERMCHILWPNYFSYISF